MTDGPYRGYVAAEIKPYTFADRLCELAAAAEKAHKEAMERKALELWPKLKEHLEAKANGGRTAAYFADGLFEGVELPRFGSLLAEAGLKLESNRYIPGLMLTWGKEGEVKP